MWSVRVLPPCCCRSCGYEEDKGCRLTSPGSGARLHHPGSSPGDWRNPGNEGRLAAPSWAESAAGEGWSDGVGVDGRTGHGSDVLEISRRSD